jgi:hypothetical protein
MHQSAMPQKEMRRKVTAQLHTLTLALDGGKRLKVLPALPQVKSLLVPTDSWLDMSHSYGGKGK